MADETNEQTEGNEEAAQNGGGSSLVSRLLSKDVLIPAAATAATAVAAGFAAKKAPDMKSLVSGGAKDAAKSLGQRGAEGAKDALAGGGGGGALGAVAGGAAKLMGGGGGSRKKTRRLPIQRWTDIAVPVEEAFERWTKFEEFPKFMHRVLSVQQDDKNRLEWEEKIWFSRRQWQGEITDLRKNDRVAWKTVSGPSHSGIVSFHELDDRLTRVLVTVDFQPTGMMEKMASGLRFVKRAVQADLARFKAYVELEDAKGLEYQVAPDEDESDESDKSDNEDKSDKSDESDESDEKDSDANDDSKASRNGSAANGERDAEREERESRRQERRGALSSR